MKTSMISRLLEAYIVYTMCLYLSSFERKLVKIRKNKFVKHGRVCYTK